MKGVHLMIVTALACAVAFAQVSGAVVVQQAPVREGVAPIDAPSADLERGNAEARLPTAEAVPAAGGEQPPAVEQPEPVQQPPVEP